MSNDVFDYDKNALFIDYHDKFSLLDFSNTYRVIKLSDLFKAERVESITCLINYPITNGIHIQMDIESDNVIIDRFINHRARQCQTLISRALGYKCGIYNK